MERTATRALNNLYEVGILPVKSAGNEYHSSTTDCNLTAPAAAAGALVVGSIGDDNLDDTTSEMRNANISDFSSRGGTSSQGGSRSIVDLVAAGVRGNMMGIASNTSYAYSDSGTSISTPYVAGAALNLVDFLMMQQNWDGTDVFQNLPLRLVLNGISISADNVSSAGAGWGINEMLVWFAYYYEDSDRESWENLGDGTCTDEMDCASRE